MAELARDRSREIEEKKIPLTQDRLHIASKQIEDDGVAEKMPWPVVQEESGDELPGISRLNTAFAEREKVVNDAGLGRFEEKLGHECGHVRAD